MRQPQVASSEGAPGVSVARKVTVKNGGGRREEDEKPGDCLKLGNRRVLVKIPGNKPKAVTTSGADAPQSQHQQQPQVNKYNNSSSNDLKPEVGHIQDEEVIDSQAQQSSSKRPISDAVSLPQWGQKKRQRCNNRGAAAEEQQPPASTTTTDLKAAARGRASSVKSPSVPTVRIKRPAFVAPKFPPSPELDNRRNVETTGATTTCNGSHVVNGESEANGTATRAAEVQQQQQQHSSPEKVTIVAPAESSPAAAPAPPPPPPAPAAAPSAAANTTTDRAPHPQEKVDMDLFQWPKFIVSLTRKEKEDDFFAIKGTKLPVRPKKRSKHLEKAVTFISPGAWLCDITRERYEVKEKKTIKKRPRGLKAMGSADSDTD